MIDGVDHIAIVVRDIDLALPYYVEQWGLTLVSDEDLPEVGVRVAYLDAGNTLLQLVQPTAPGPIADHLHAQGEGLHHLCFAVADIPDTLTRLDGGANVKVVMGGRDRRACFLPPQPTGLHIELTETEPHLTQKEEIIS